MAASIDLLRKRRTEGERAHQYEAETPFLYHSSACGSGDVAVMAASNPYRSRDDESAPICRSECC